MNKKGDLLHHSIIYKVLSSIFYLIAYPIIFLLTKLWHGLKIEGRENLDKVGDEYITVANHINMIDCAMITLSIFPRIPYFLTLQSNLEIPIIKYLVMLLRGIPIPRNKSGKEKMVNTIDGLLKKGEVVGYIGIFKAEEDTKIGVIPVGYADGIIRKNTGRYVYINNKKYKIVGNVCMDMLFVEIDEEVHLYDKVEVLKDNKHIKETAKHLETIPYEILCQIGGRVPRIYKNN